MLVSGNTKRRGYMFSGEKAKSSQWTCSVPENHADEVAASVLQSRSVSVSTKVTSDM